MIPSPRACLFWLAALLAASALALHLPGEVSFDSSVQLLEAQTGVSRSWNPPFMSALLQWFGGGTQAMSIFVIACTLLTYGGLALALGTEDRAGPLSSLRIAASTLVLANPVIVLYVGIVWKDVLFAALLCFACGASVAAARSTRAQLRIVLALAACIALVLAGHVRQQGLFLLPLLVLCPLFALSGDERPGVKVILGWVALACVLFLAIESWTNGRIAHQEGGDRDRGLRNMLTFDILGTAAMAGSTIAGVDATPEAIRRAYSPARIDTLSRERPLGRQLRKKNKAALLDLWLQSVSDNPRSFIRHRLAVASRVLGLKGLNQCLPVHLGIGGDAAALAQVGLQPGFDRRDQWMYQASLPLHWTPWFRHYATLAGTSLLAFCAWRRRRATEALVVLWFSLCMVAYAAFTSALAIACDFRYLYPVVTVASACALGLLGTPAPTASLTASRPFS